MSFQKQVRDRDQPIFEMIQVYAISNNTYVTFGLKTRVQLTFLKQLYLVHSFVDNTRATSLPKQNLMCFE